jgi:hypothetical protein
MPSIVDSATAVVTAVRHQRQESHQVFDQSATQTRQWLAVSIEVRCDMLCYAVLGSYVSHRRPHHLTLLLS